MPPAGLVTAEELLHMSDVDGEFELVRGELVPVNQPGAEHGRLSVVIGAALLEFVTPRKLGIVMVESGFILARDPDTVRGPDVSFVRAGRGDYPVGNGYVGGAPDFAVEVRSPSNRTTDLLAKAEEYLAAGTTLVWIVDSEREIVQVLQPGATMRTLVVGDVADGGTVLPGFALSVAELFASPF